MNEPATALSVLMVEIIITVWCFFISLKEDRHHKEIMEKLNELEKKRSED